MEATDMASFLVLYMPYISCRDIKYHYSDAINERDGVSNNLRLDCLLNVCPGADQRKHQSSASLAFVMGIHRWRVDSSQKMAGNADKVSKWWRHHVVMACLLLGVKPLLM